MALTPKKRRFIDALREGASKKDAAIAAGYSEKTASAAGSRLAKDLDVIAELHKLNALGPVKGAVNKNEGDPATRGSSITPSADVQDGGESRFDLARALNYSDPKAYLLAAMNDREMDPKLRVDAAKALMPFVHQRKGETGKKEDRQNAAEEAAAGLYGTSKPPLRSVK
jgi:phage terminase small subunit